MKASPFLIAIAILCFSIKSIAQTTIVSASNFQIIDLNDQGIPNRYPAEITIAGGLDYISGIQVDFPKFYMDGPARDLDILLEAPGGKRVMLMSDLLSLPIPYIPAPLRIASSASVTLDTPGPHLLGTAFQPVNLGVASDFFPLPGPGSLTSTPATFAELMNENPNGTWRLWIVDDSSAYSFFTLDDGWKLTLETSSTPVCIQPALPKLIAVTDNTAQIAWKGEGPALRWDIYYGQAEHFLPVPDDNTIPNITDWQDDSIEISGLLPAKDCEVYIRSVCPDGGRSRWVGPLSFKTLLTPCLYANPVQLNEINECSISSALPEYDLLLPCGADKKWIFRFVAPETGKYWVNTDQLSSVIWMRDDATSNACAFADWHCTTLDTLAAGEAIFVMIMKDLQPWPPPVFNISRCPASNVTLHQNSYEPLTTSIRFEGMPYNETSHFDLFYTLDSTFLPVAGTVPLENDFFIYPPDDQAIHALVAHDLAPSSSYWFWVRPLCEGGAATGVWKGPFPFYTTAFCGAIDSVWIDDISDHSARLHFIAPSQSEFEAEVKLASNGQYVIPEAILFNANTAGQVFQRNIIGIEPNTAYEIYLKATCTGGGENPWYGPFPFTTKPGCFLDVQDIQCGESVQGIHFSDTIPDAYSDFNYSQCNAPWQIGTLNERLFRFTASKTGYAYLYYSNATGDDYSYLRWFIKDADLGCTSAGFESLTCGSLSTEFVVDSGTTYLLLAEGAYTYPEGSDFYANFVIFDCAPPCPAVDSSWVESATATSASLRWRNASPGATYRINYNSDAGGATQFISTADTSLTISGLLPNARYTFWVVTLCNGGEPTEGMGITQQLGDHVVLKEAPFTRCNPHFLPPGGSIPANYEVFELIVPQDGDYRLIAPYWSNLFVYEDVFDPESPFLHLLLSDVETTAAGRIDTLFAFQTGKVYQCVVSMAKTNPGYPFFNANGNKPLKFVVDGPAEVQLSEPKSGSIEPAAHGKVPFEYSGFHTGTCRDTAGWVHYYGIATDPNKIEEDNLLLSIKVENDVDSLNLLPMAMYNNPPAAVLLQNPPTSFIQNPDGWYEMNRAWLMQNLLPEQQIDADFSIRFYYTQADYELMKTAIESAGGNLDNHEAMYFHKINGFHQEQFVLPLGQHMGVPGATAYDSIGYWSYANGPEATTSTWRHGFFAGEHYAEMVVHGFSGGGGGASVNGRGISDPLSKTSDITPGTGLKLSPNPNAGVFSVELPEAAKEGMILRLTGITGQVLLEQRTQQGLTLQTVEAGRVAAGTAFPAGGFRG